MAGKLLLLYLSVSALCWVGTNASQLDWVVDEILAKVMEPFVSHPETSIEIPPITLNIEKDWLSIDYPLILTTSDGVLQDLSTVHRTFPAQIYQGSNASVQELEATLGLKTFSVAFSEVKGKAVGYKDDYFHGSMSVSCSTNGLDLGVRTEKLDDGTCNTSLTSIDVTEISDCTWGLKAVKAVDKLKIHYILPALQQHFKNVTSTFSDHVVTFVQKILEGEDFCQYLNPH